MDFVSFFCLEDIKNITEKNDTPISVVPYLESNAPRLKKIFGDTSNENTAVLGRSAPKFIPPENGPKNYLEC